MDNSFQEIRDILKENAIQLEKLAVSQKNLEISQEKTDKKFEELAVFQKQTSQEIRELKDFQKQTDKKFEELAVFQKQTSQEIRELKDFQKQTTQNIDKLSKNFGSFTNNQGDIIEILFFNALKEDLTLDNVKYEFISLNEERISENTEQEFDIILVNSNQIAIIEVKGKAHENDIEKLDEIVKNYRLLFPEYKTYKLQSYLGSLHFNKKIKEDIKETNHKLLLLKGNTIQVL